MRITEKPKALVGDFALLKVISTNDIGAFLEWGQPKDLFLPFAEQIHELRPEEEIVVYIYRDKSQRFCASMRLERFLQKLDRSLSVYKEEQSVDLLIIKKTDLGYKAIINGSHLGVLYENEVFQALNYGQEIKGFIKKIREDGKIDLSLSKSGHQSATDIAPKIILMLEKNNGFLAIHNKTEADTIYQLFGISKKKYKLVLSGLYKQRLITIHDDGIRLISTPSED